MNISVTTMLKVLGKVVEEKRARQAVHGILCGREKDGVTRWSEEAGKEVVISLSLEAVI